MREARDHGEVCGEVREFLASAGGCPLSPKEDETLRLHLESCADCLRVREEHRAVWDLLGKAPLPRPPSSDAAFLASTRARVKRTSALWIGGALAAAGLLVALGLGWLLPPREDQAVIENLAVLEDLQGVPGSPAQPEVADVGLELIALLADESSAVPAPDDEEDWGEDEALLDDGGKRG